MKCASVILDIPTQALDAPYTYAFPEDSLFESESEYAVEVGCAVLVPLGGRRAVGFVVDVFEAEGQSLGVSASRIKPILRVLSHPYFDEEGAACAQWLSERYVAPLSSCVRLFTPPGGVPKLVRNAHGGWQLKAPSVGEVDDRWVVPGSKLDAFTPRKNALKQQAVIEALRCGEVRVAELAAQLGSVASTLQALQKKCVIEIESRRRYRTAMPGAFSGNDASSFKCASDRPALTAGQLNAVNAIERVCDAQAGGVVCVDGVTGSGKTEVYLRAIEHVLEKGRTACVLVPEISLTPQIVARFRARFGDMVAVMHSRMSAGERYDQWDFIRSGAARVVVGARSALFTPLANRGLIVIDEEHEGSYKQDSAPRYAARDVAVWLAKRSGAAVVLGSATPSIETLYSCETNPLWQRVELPERANGKAMPGITVVDMAKEFGKGSRSMFSKELSSSLQAELASGRKAVLLLNQRGFAKFLLCRECGFVPECPSCSTSLTYHERGNVLICHHCGYRISAPVLCPECASPSLKRFGAGTQRVEDELRALLNGMPGVGENVPIIRMDADTTSAKGAHERLLGQFASAKAAVLLGTQMIAKGLDFDDVTLVGVINADTQLHLPDYRAAERTFALIEQVAGRAGRAELPGRVLVQTYEADNIAIRAAATYDRALFLRAELPKRKMLGYPPYVRMANVLVWGKDEPQVRATACRIHDELLQRLCEAVEGGGNWDILPAAPCVLARLRATYRWHIVIKCPIASDVSAFLLPYFRAHKPDGEVHVTVDVDPSDLL